MANATASQKECALPLSQKDIEELHMVFIAQPVLMLACSLPTTVLNLLVVVGVYKTPSLHSPSNVLLCGLALTDLGAWAIAMPIFAILSIAYAVELSSLRCFMNILSKLLVTPFSGVSFVTMTLISLDRMVALKFHMKYSIIITTRRVMIVLVFTWIAAYIIASSHLWCIEVINWSTVIIFIFCLVVCTFNNAVIFRVLRYHRIQIARQQQQLQANEHISNNKIQHQRKTSHTTLWIYLLFILCYTPFLIARVFKNYSDAGTKTLYIFFNTSYVVMYLNSLMNPILYCIKMRPIRKAIMRLLPEQFLSLFKINNNNNDVET